MAMITFCSTPLSLVRYSHNIYTRSPSKVLLHVVEPRFHPNGPNILNWNYKLKLNMVLIHETYLRQGEKEEARPPVTPMTPHSATATGPLGCPLMHASHIDMSMGMHSQSRGYDFAQEENGVAIRQMQSNLSGVSPSPHTPIKGRGHTLLHTICHPLHRKQPTGDQ